MTSEIRTNSLKSRAGLSTVTLTDSGPMFSGITTFVDNSGFNIGTGSSIFSPATNTLTFGTNSNERVRIISDGKVGINESSPSQRLHVGGDVQIGFNTPNDAGRQINFNVNRSSAGQTLANINWQWNNKFVAQIRGIAGSDTTNKDDAHLAFFTSSANNLSARLRIHPDGGVTIGDIAATTTKAGILHTRVSNTTRPVVFENDTENSDVVIKTTGTNKHSILGFGDGASNFAGNIDYDHQNNAMVFDTNGGERLNISSSGVVTQVETGTGNGNGGIKASTASGGGNAGFGFITGGTQRFNVTTIGSAGSESLRVYDNNNSTERLRIDSTGDIGLGESNPNRSGYSSPVVSVGYNSSNGYGVLELLGSQTSDNTIANIVAYNVGGSSRLAAIAFERSGANNTGAIRFETYTSGSSAERLRIASDGDTTISASTSANFLPGAALNVISDKNVNSGLDDKVNYHLALANPNNDTNEAIGIAFGITDTSTKVGAAIVHQRDAAGSQGHMKFFTRPSNAGPPLERVRIRADGNFYVNSSNNSIVGQPSFYASNNDGCGSYRPHSGFPIHHFYSNAGGTFSLESYVNGDGSYVNLSDYRLKENIVSISNGIDIVKQLNPVKFDWKSSSKTKNDLGFIAHEVQTLIPTAVDGTKDQMKEDGSPFYQGIAQTKIIPYLTAALKEAITKIEKLEQDNIALRVRVTNLEGN